MKQVLLSPIKRFKCISSKCANNCCVGWQIDIDKKSLSRYRKLTGEKGERIKKSVDFSNRCFRRINGRCALLNDCNLCNLITELGEGALCQVCVDHPRFRNFFSDRTETGLGLCCEEACRLIITSDRPFEENVMSDDGHGKLTEWEKELLAFRTQAVEMLFDGSVSFSEKLKSLKDLCAPFGKVADPVLFADLYSGLECIAPEWLEFVKKIKTAKRKVAVFDKEYQNILAYFIYRHVSRATDGKDLKVRIAFCLLSYGIISALCDIKNAQSGCTLSDLAEICRAYSAETEYSEDNMKKILNNIKYR